MESKGDIAVKTPGFSGIAVDYSELELDLILDRPVPAGGQNVDRRS